MEDEKTWACSGYYRYEWRKDPKHYGQIVRAVCPSCKLESNWHTDDTRAEIGLQQEHEYRARR